MLMTRCYSDLIQIDSFMERFYYLKLHGKVAEETFGLDRYLNQALYRSPKWKQARSKVILRDDACDLGVEGYEMGDYITVHHMNPISLEDIEEERDWIFDPEYLISCSPRTHKAIHFGDEKILPKEFVGRRPNDTTLWRN